MKKIVSIFVLFAFILTSFAVFADAPFTKNITKSAEYDNLIKISGDVERDSNITLLVLKTGNYANETSNGVRANTMDEYLATSYIAFISEKYCTTTSGFSFDFYVPDGAVDGDLFTIWVGNTQTGNTILESGFIYREFDPMVSVEKVEGETSSQFSSKVAVGTADFSTYCYFPLSSGKVSDSVDIKRWKLFANADGTGSLTPNFMIASYSGLKALQVKNNVVATNSDTTDLYIRGYYYDNAYDGASVAAMDGIDYSNLKYAETTGASAFLDNYVEGKITVLPPAKISSFNAAKSNNTYTFTLKSDDGYAQAEDVNYDIQYKLSGGSNVSFTDLAVSGNTATKQFDVSTLPSGDYYIIGSVANKYSQQLVQDKVTLEETVTATGAGVPYKITDVSFPETIVAGTAVDFTCSVTCDGAQVTSGIDSLVKIVDRVDKVGNPVADVTEENGDGTVSVTFPKVGEYVVTFNVKKNGDVNYHSAISRKINVVESADITTENFETVPTVDGTNVTFALPTDVTINQGGADGYSVFVVLANASEAEAAVAYQDSVTVTDGKITVESPLEGEVTSAVISYRSNETGQVYTCIVDITE